MKHERADMFMQGTSKKMEQENLTFPFFTRANKKAAPNLEAVIFWRQPLLRRKMIFWGAPFFTRRFFQPDKKRPNLIERV